jgi:CheY-like chemotaxis protein
LTSLAASTPAECFGGAFDKFAEASMKVLVVDDDPVVLVMTEAVLQSLGHEVITRDRALGTSAAIYVQRPDVVLIDVEMPGLSGDELVRISHEKFAVEGHEIAFIFYSGHEREELERLVEETGAVGAIDKASGPTGLARQFSEIVENI